MSFESNDSGAKGYDLTTALGREAFFNRHLSVGADWGECDDRFANTTWLNGKLYRGELRLSGATIDFPVTEADETPKAS